MKKDNGKTSRGFYPAQFMQLERAQLRPLSHIPRSDINGIADFDAGQNYTRPQSAPDGVYPYPAMIGMVQGFMPQMTDFIINNVDIKPPSTFYDGGSSINLQGDMSFGFGINGLKKIKG